MAPGLRPTVIISHNFQYGNWQIPIHSNAFCITVAGDVFQQKLNECFGHIKNLIVIADDVMIIGKNENHKDHDIAFTTLLHTARKCNIKLNFDKLKFKCTEVNFYSETYTRDGCKPAQDKIQAIVKMPPPLIGKKYNHSWGWSITWPNSHLILLNYLSQSES